ncbi:beta-ketoacyl synthase chain length factor [uncultured Campylobacter sp.]|uniref:beta-ketoacyl synthase chain length factor n=1 Tax=uncultured Campylobacter sp. TaxID=218934 RepID=UPI00262D5102|nr:beta-ketoacyl synthase chain length factor [uncultured Campylobacter sp.]
MQNKLSFGVAYASAIISGEPAELYKKLAACSDGISEVNLGGNSDLACDANQNFTYDFLSNSTQDFTDIPGCEQNSTNPANFAAFENRALQKNSEENLEISTHARLKEEILALEPLKKKPALEHIPPLQRRRLGLGAKLCISLLGEISQNTPQSLAEESSLNLAPQNLDASKSRFAAQNPLPQDFSNENSLNFMQQNLDSAPQDFTNENSLNSTPQDLINENSLNSARQNSKTNESLRVCDHAMQSSATQREGMPLVFCSRLGEINRCFSLLGSMSESVSPSSFCVSVLNAIAAQNAIFTQNHAEISTISAACALENGAIIAAARLKESAENFGSAQDANEAGKDGECKSDNDKIALLCYFEEANNDYLKRCDFACALLLVLQRGDDVQIEISPQVADATTQSIEIQNPKSRAENEILRSFKEGGEIPLDTAVEFLAKILSGKREWRSSDGVLDYLWRVKDPAKIAAFLRQDREH